MIRSATERGSRGGRLTLTLVLLWIAAMIAAFFFVGRPGRRSSSKPSPAGWKIWPDVGSIKALAVLPEAVVCGGSAGLFRIAADGPAQAVPIPGAGRNTVVYALLWDTDGGLWVGHEDGLSILRDGRWTSLRRGRELPDGSVRAMAATKDGHVWLATTRGAARLPARGPWTGDGIETLTEAHGLPDDLLSAVLEDREGGLWFGTHAAPSGGLSRLKDGRWTHWTLRDGLPHADIVCLMLDRSGRLWAGCGLYDRGGAALFAPDSGEWRLDRTIPLVELAGPKVRSLWEDDRGRIWIGSEFDGVAVRSGERTIRVLTVKDGLSAQEVMAIAGAPDGAVWLGTIDGLTRIGPEALASLFPESAQRRMP